VPAGIVCHSLCDRGALLSLAVGAKPIPLASVVEAFTGFDGSNDHLVVRELRLPRTLVGVLVGAALGMAGALMQAITRNPLADPGLLGVNAGASLAVVIGISVFGMGSLSAYVWLAFVGAAITSVVVYALGSMGRGGATPVRLALAGAALSALLGALTSAVVLLDQATLDQFRFWVVGSLAGRDQDVWSRCSRSSSSGSSSGSGAPGRSTRSASARRPPGARHPRRVDPCGDGAVGHAAVRRRHRCVRADRVHRAGRAAAARAVVGPDQRWLLPYSAVLGPIVLLVCDVVGRVIARPSRCRSGS
jgi:iron complex transport system permease protein